MAVGAKADRQQATMASARASAVVRSSTLTKTPAKAALRPSSSAADDRHTTRSAPTAAKARRASLSAISATPAAPRASWRVAAKSTVCTGSRRSAASSR